MAGAQDYTWMSPQPGYESVHNVPTTYGGQSGMNSIAASLGMTPQEYTARNRQMSDPMFWMQHLNANNFPGLRPENSYTNAFANQYGLRSGSPVQPNIPEFNAQSTSDWLGSHGGFNSQVGQLADQILAGYNSQMGSLFPALQSGMAGAFGPGVAGGSPVLDAKYAATFAPLYSGVVNNAYGAALNGVNSAVAAQNAWDAGTRGFLQNQFENTRSLGAQIAGHLDNIASNWYDRANQYNMQGLTLASNMWNNVMNAGLRAATTPDQQYTSKTPMFNPNYATNYVGGGGGGGGGTGSGVDNSLDNDLKAFQAWSNGNKNRNQVTGENYDPNARGNNQYGNPNALPSGQ